MGVFTEQVQGLVSEEKTKRQEREKKKQEQLRKEELKKHLYYMLSSYFTETQTQDYQKTYINLLKDSSKWEIIGNITRKENEEYFLDTNYISILNKVKTSYIIQYKEYLKEEKEKQKQYNNNKKQYYLSVLQGRTTFIKKRKNKPLLFLFNFKKIYILYILLLLKIFIRIVFEPLFLLSNILICLTILKSLKTSYTHAFPQCVHNFFISN